MDDDNPRAPFLDHPAGCLTGDFVARHKRFSVEIDCGGNRLLAHSNNSGSMLGLLRPGNPVLVSPAGNPARKLAFTQECIRLEDSCATMPGRGFWVGVNTSVPNRMLRAAFLAGSLDFTAGYEEIRMEARCGQSRLDALISAPGRPRLWVECKNVTLVEDGVAAFPDAASKRGQKHLLELMERVAAGERGAMFFLVQRPDAGCFAPADYIDSDYAALFYLAMARGVEMYAMTAHVSPAGIELGNRLRIQPPHAELQKMLAKKSVSIY